MFSLNYDVVSKATLVTKNIFVAFLWSLLAVWKAYADTNIDAPYTLRIGTMDLAPYGQINENGKMSGIIYEMNQEIGERSDMLFINSIIPFKRMVNLLEHGKLDLISTQPHKAVVEAGELLAIQHEVNVIAVSKKILVYLQFRI